MNRPLLAALCVALLCACAGPPPHNSVINVPRTATDPFPSSSRDDEARATIAAITNHETRLYYPQFSATEVGAECLGARLFTDTDLQGGRIATIGANELVHLVPDPLVTLVVGSTPMRGTMLLAVTDDHHIGLLCGDNLTIVDPSTKAAT